MQPQPLPLFGAPTLKRQMRGIAGVSYGDNLRWKTPKSPSRALVGKVLGFTQRCTLLAIKTADHHIITLRPEDVINTSRQAKP